MLTKKQVFDAAMQYAHEQNPDQNKAGIEINDDFIAGARWAAEQMQAKNARLIERNRHLEEGLENAVFVLNRKIEEVFSLRAAIDKALSHEHFAQSHRTGCGLVLEILKNALK